MSRIVESSGLMEPLLPQEAVNDLDDLVIDLITKSSQLTAKINPIVAQSIGDLVRSMNCYYSNLIEGHNTHPRDIDRAMADDYAVEPKKRALQLEAVAHISTQALIDKGQDCKADPLSAEYALWLHKEFCQLLPDELLWIENPETGEKIKVIPGELRTDEVRVGRHEPPFSYNLPSFLARFDEAYNPNHLSRLRRVIAVAAAHHRFLWIHPFADGNGRVARLMSHAALLRQNVGSPLWSVARGLARRVSEYKQLLMAADERRQGDLDGRGTLSEKNLIAFCKFFLEICIDQVEYMTDLIQPDKFERRLRLYVEEEVASGQLPRGSFQILREVYLSGEVERGRVGEITGYQERAARDLVTKLTTIGLLTSQAPRLPVRLAFPYAVTERLFPALYPV